MIQDNLNNSYDNNYNAEAKPSDDSFVLYFHNNELLCHAEGNVASLETAIPGKAGSEKVVWRLLTLGEIRENINTTENKLIYLFKMDIDGENREFFLLTDDSLLKGTGLAYSRIKDSENSGNSESGDYSTDGLYYIPASKFRSLIPLSTSFAVITAWQLYSWYRDNRYCGRCIG